MKLGWWVLKKYKFAPLAVLAAALFMSGCTNPMMPVAGPESWDTRREASDVSGTDNRLPYALVKLDPQVMSILVTNRAGIFGDVHRSASAERD